MRQIATRTRILSTSDLWFATLQRSRTRFMDLACRQPVTALLIQLNAPAPEAMVMQMMRPPRPIASDNVATFTGPSWPHFDFPFVTKCSGLFGAAGPHLVYALWGRKDHARYLHLFGQDETVCDPLVAASSEAWGAAAGLGVDEANAIWSSPVARPAEGAFLWLHLLFELLWTRQLTSMPPLRKCIQVIIDGGEVAVNMDDLDRPEIDSPGDKYGRAVELARSSRSWFYSAFPDVAGVSAAVVDWILATYTGNPSAAGKSTLAGETSKAELPPGEWLIPPQSLASLANRLGNITPEKAKMLLIQYGLRNYPPYNRQSWTVNLGGMPATMRQQLDPRSKPA